MIRQARLIDEDKIHSLVLEFMKEGWDKYPFKINETLRDTIKNVITNGILFINDNNGDINGLIGGIVSPTIFCGKQLLAQEILWYVRKEKRQGISMTGFKLLKSFEKESKRRGANLIVLSHIGNLNAEYMKKMFSKNKYTLFETQYIKEAM